MDMRRAKEEIAEIIRSNATPQAQSTPAPPGLTLHLPPEFVARLLELLLKR